MGYLLKHSLEMICRTCNCNGKTLLKEGLVMKSIQMKKNSLRGSKLFCWLNQKINSMRISKKMTSTHLVLPSCWALKTEIESLILPGKKGICQQRSYLMLTFKMKRCLNKCLITKSIFTPILNQEETRFINQTTTLRKQSCPHTTVTIIKRALT